MFYKQQWDSVPVTFNRRVSHVVWVKSFCQYFPCFLYLPTPVIKQPISFAIFLTSKPCKNWQVWETTTWSCTNCKLQPDNHAQLGEMNQAPWTSPEPAASAVVPLSWYLLQPYYTHLLSLLKHCSRSFLFLTDCFFCQLYLMMNGDALNGCHSFPSLSSRK